MGVVKAGIGDGTSSYTPAEWQDAAVSYPFSPIHSLSPTVLPGEIVGTAASVCLASHMSRSSRMAPDCAAAFLEAGLEQMTFCDHYHMLTTGLVAVGQNRNSSGRVSAADASPNFPGTRS